MENAVIVGYDQPSVGASIILLKMQLIKKDFSGRIG